MGKPAKTLAQVLAKLDSPPAAHNFAKSNFKRKMRTVSALVNLALGFPKVSYQWALKVVELTVADRLSDRNAIALLMRICPASQIDDNLDLLNAFLSYNSVRKFDGIQIFPEFRGRFEAGPNVSIPVSPTIIIRENGALKPLFVIGWAANTLDYSQRRLLSSIYEDSIYTLTDFRKSDGEVLFFPKDGFGNRKLERWRRGTFEPLSRSELVAQIAQFVEAREEARPLIAMRYEERRMRAGKGASKGTSSYDRPDGGDGKEAR